MYTREITGLLVSYGYAASVLGLGELLYRFLAVPQFYTRKFVHIWAGMWVFGIMMLMPYRWYIGIIPFATFILVNFVLWRFRLAKSVDDNSSSLGTVYFAAAITLIYALLWRPVGPTDYGSVAAAGVMALTWGDALAAIVGKNYGRHHYTIFGTTRSIEGSLAMFVASFIAMFLVLAYTPGTFIAYAAPWLTVQQAALAALVGAALATLAEALTPRGLDNLTVPLVASGAVWLLVR